MIPKRFRAWFTSSYYDEEGNEIEVGFYVYNVGVSYNGTTISFDKDYLIESLNKQGFTEYQQKYIIGDFESNNMCDDDEFICVDYGIAEQSIDYKDINGKEIYENDILTYENDKGETEGITVQYNKHMHGFNIPPFSKHYEVIGNTHEEKQEK